MLTLHDIGAFHQLVIALSYLSIFVLPDCLEANSSKLLFEMAEMLTMGGFFDLSAAFVVVGATVFLSTDLLLLRDFAFFLGGLALPS